uniref:Sulfatase N-terminal domain-containing protein n=1 Tax=Paracidobacterium acidisoli TaxID=2303751 RepID=A0A372IM10_9BACT
MFSLGICWNQISPTHIYLYHRLLPVTTVVRATVIDLVLACLLGTALVWLLDRIDAKGRTLLWLIFATLLVARVVGGLMAAEVILRLAIVPIKFWLPVAIVGLLLWIFARNAYAASVRGLRVLLLLLGICIFWMLPELIVLSMTHGGPETASFSKPLPEFAAPHRRVVWLLFDEMSYDQAFVHRWPGLNLPNFDRLRGQSVVFSDLQPAGFYTEQIVPSLFLGRSIVEIRASPQGWLHYRSVSGGHWQIFDGNQTVFADAQRQGWTTGIVGTFNPYCRLMTGALDFCWSQLLPFKDHFVADQSTFENVTAPVRAEWGRLTHHPFRTPSPEEEFADILSQSRSAIANEKLDFVLVHLPLPHPPGIYNRQTGRIGPGGGYVDNLALADRTLAELRQIIDQTHSAQQTTLVISSDHSWRIPLWRHQIGWTNEDETVARSRGFVFDMRPVLIVRFPGEITPTPVNRALPLLDMHNMLEQIISGQIASPEQLKQWAVAQPTGH